jgi:hypothetical protein
MTRTEPGHTLGCHRAVWLVVTFRLFRAGLLAGIQSVPGRRCRKSLSGPGNGRRLLGT